MSDALVERFDGVEQLSRAAAEHLVQLAAAAIADRGRFIVALSGGSTPRLLFRLLAQPQYSARVAWEAVHVCWSDERCVPPDHADSNYRMAHEELLSHVPIPASNVHRMRGELEPQDAAQEYEATLRGLLASTSSARSHDGDRRSRTVEHRFDLVLLGLGTDGHTASLFPGGHAVHEQARWVVAEQVQRVGAWRLTLTPPLINASAEVLFLATGADKASVLSSVLTEQPDIARWPAQVVAPSRGVVHWMVDADAAASLRDERPSRRSS